jgi:hypothetical protein
MDKPLSALGVTLGVQLIGFSCAVAASSYLFVPYLVHGAVAATLALWVGATWPWVIMNGLIPLGGSLVLAAEDGDPILTYSLGAFSLLLLLIYIPTFWTRVPLFLSDKDVVQKLLELLPAPHQPEQQGLTFAELGAGTGMVLFTLARNRPDIHFTAFELSPLLCVLLLLRSLRYDNVTIRYCSFWKTPLGHYDLLFAFLSPEPMEQLWYKLYTEATKDFTLYSNQFPILSQAENAQSYPLTNETALYGYTLKRNSRRSS